MAVVEAIDLKEALLAQQCGADAVIAKGHEGAGRIGDGTTFVLVQQFVANLSLPVWAQGGIGLHSAAAVVTAGASGIVLDAQLPRWSPSTTRTPLVVLPETELRTVADQLATLGVSAHHWEYHRTTGTVVLSAPAHPTLLAAVRRFSQGCPWHHSTVCDAPISAGGHGCRWHTDGHNAAIWPRTTGCSCRPAVTTYTSRPN